MSTTLTGWGTRGTWASASPSLLTCDWLFRAGDGRALARRSTAHRPACWHRFDEYELGLDAGSISGTARWLRDSLAIRGERIPSQEAARRVSQGDEAKEWCPLFDAGRGMPVRSRLVAPMRRDWRGTVEARYRSEGVEAPGSLPRCVDGRTSSSDRCMCRTTARPPCRGRSFRASGSWSLACGRSVALSGPTWSFRGCGIGLATLQGRRHSVVGGDTTDDGPGTRHHDQGATPQTVGTILPTTARLDPTSQTRRTGRPSPRPKSVDEARRLLALSAPSPVVVVPIYNAYADVVRCMESLLADTPTSHSILVVDDRGADRRGISILLEVSGRTDHDVVAFRGEQRRLRPRGGTTCSTSHGSRCSSC